MNHLLIVANVGVYAAQVARPEVMGGHMLNAQGLALSQFLTYAFLHIGPGHLGCNMVVLWMLGRNVNDRLGQMGYLGFYLAGGVLAGVAFIVTGGRSMVGASGAIGGVMGAYLALLPDSKILVWLPRVCLEVRSIYFISIFLLYNVLMSFISGSEVQGVAYQAHIAGIVFGFLMMLLLQGVGLLARERDDFLAGFKGKEKKG